MECTVFKENYLIYNLELWRPLFCFIEEELIEQYKQDAALFFEEFLNIFEKRQHYTMQNFEILHIYCSDEALNAAKNLILYDILFHDVIFKNDPEKQNAIYEEARFLRLQQYFALLCEHNNTGRLWHSEDFDTAYFLPALVRRIRKYY